MKIERELFEAWFSKYLGDNHKAGESHYVCSWSAWQASQQSKIDELQGRIDATEKWIEANKKTIALSEWHGYTTEEYVDADDLLDILKGGSSE